MLNLLGFRQESVELLML